MNHLYRWLALSWLATTSCFGLAQTPTANYIISRTYKQAGINENLAGTNFTATANQATSQVSYFDGLGKPTQQVAAFGAGSKADIVTITEYDALQRPVRTFLPTPMSSNGGQLRAGADVKTAAKDYYTSSTKVSAPIAANAQPETFSTQTFYENAPLNRVTGSKAPGASGNSTQFHGVNVADEVKYYRANGTALTDIQSSGTYAAGELTYTRTTDGAGGAVTQYLDRLGRLVLKRTLTSKNNQDVNLDTYYVYDEKGQLRSVLQPGYQNEADLNRNAFLYRYDEYGRLVEKKLPGSNALNIEYHGTTDLPKTNTDGRGQKFYYLYDNQNRQIEMGLCKDGNCDTPEPLLKTYYDNYGFTPFQTYSAEPGMTGVTFASTPTANRAGLMTGKAARVLLSDGTYGQWLQTVIYYDDKQRVIQTLRQLYGFSSSAFERVSFQLAFDGKPQQEWITQQTGTITYKLAKTFTYDHADRLSKTDLILYEGGVLKKTYTQSEQLYDEVGRVGTKSLHAGVQILGYKYTPRGWLGNQQTSTGQPFTLGLSYQDNGNINSLSWTTKSYSGGMSLSYDKSRRLTGAAGNGNFAGYEESSIGYDANGNLESLTRKYNTTTIDQLSYLYHGNQLHRVNDPQDNQSQAVKGFLNGADKDDELRYDGNGNLLRDLNRGIGNETTDGINYNVLNLPRRVVRNGRIVQYVYDASGVKLKSEAPDNDNTYYAGTFEYLAENTLLRIGTEEGQIVKEGTTYLAQYYLRDHLGNVRSVMNENGNVIQETEYYAFGLAIPRIAGTNKYLYNGKEKQPETEWLDYGARQYDPTIGRWMVVDPLAELSISVSGYAYVENDPIRKIDLFGLIDINNDGTDDGISLPEATVKGKRPDPLFAQYELNSLKYSSSKPSPYSWSRNEINTAVKYEVAAVSLYAGGVMAGGGLANWQAGPKAIAQLRKLAAARQILQKTYSMVVAKSVSQQALYGKAGLSLLGQTVGNLLKGEMKIDFVGLAADLSLTSGASSLTGAIGEMGVDLSAGTFYGETNSLQVGAFKLSSGLGFGTLGGQAADMMSANGFSKAMAGMAEGMMEVYNQVIDTMASKMETPKK